MRIVFVSPTSLGLGCGVGDHGHRLAEAMARSAEVWLAVAGGGSQPPPAGLAGILEFGPARRRLQDGRRFRRWLAEVRPDAVLLQHAPHLESPRGLNVRGVPLAGAARSAGVPTWVYFHETARPFAPRPRAVVQALVQRAIAASLLGLARGAFVPSRERAEQIARLDPTRRVRIELVPVGSNIRVRPLRPGAREAIRAPRGIGPESLVLAFFGRGHESLREGWALAALEAALATGADAHLVAIGEVACRVAAAARSRSFGNRVHALGFLPEAEVSAWLSTADVFLLPLSDGASTRRGTLAAALGHGVATVATEGVNTDRTFFAGGFVELAGGRDPAPFADAVARLAREPDRRRALAASGHAAYLERLSWERLAARMLEALSPPRPRP